MVNTRRTEHKFPDRTYVHQLHKEMVTVSRMLLLNMSRVVGVA